MASSALQRNKTKQELNLIALLFAPLDTEYRLNKLSLLMLIIQREKEVETIEANNQCLIYSLHKEPCLHRKSSDDVMIRSLSVISIQSFYVIKAQG